MAGNAQSMPQEHLNQKSKMITKEQFDVIYENLHVNSKLHKDFVYECFSFASESAQSLVENNAFGKAVPINPVVLLLYIIHEYGYFLDCNNNEIKEDEELASKIVSISLDKYFTNEHLNFKNENKISKYAPQISTLETYLNFALSVLSKVATKNPNISLMSDVLYKGFSMCKAIIELMEDGFFTEAFSTWRTLHETECVLLLLDKYGKQIRDAYLRHLTYTMAFRGVIKDKDEVDKIFVEIKDEMKKLDLKSKDMKKFIEYGWLRVIPSYNEDPQFKFNFRDGVEKLAGLSNYSQVYEMASEIAHSSPMLIYSKDTYFGKITLLHLYESFFRIERLFSRFYLSIASDDDKKRYDAMKKVYFTNLQIIYTKEKEKLN